MPKDSEEVLNWFKSGFKGFKIIKHQMIRRTKAINKAVQTNPFGENCFA